MSLLKALVCTGLAVAALYLAAELGGQRLGAQPAQQEEPDELLLAPFKARPIKVEKKDDELHRLLKERYNAALMELATRYLHFRYGRGILTQSYEAKRHFLHAGLELHEKPAEQLVLYTDCAKIAQEIDKIVQERYNTGRASRDDLFESRYQRADAELQLLRARQKARPAERK